MSKINRSEENFAPGPASKRPPALFGSGRLKTAAFSKTRQVLLIGNGNAFADGIANLLGRQPKLRVRHASYQDDVSLMNEVRLARPDVLVLIRSRAMQLESIVSALMTTQAQGNLRLVILSMETSKIEIHERGKTVDGNRSTNIIPVKVDDFLLAMQKSWNLLSDVQPL